MANRKLTPAGGKVELVDQASKGETVIQIKLADPCRARVARVLSTGAETLEQLAQTIEQIRRLTGLLDFPEPRSRPTRR